MAGAFDKSPEKLQPMVKIAHDNADRLKLLIDDLLDMEKFGVEKIDLHLKATNLNRLVDEAVEANGGYAVEHGVTYICSHKNLSLVANVDKDRLMQVMANLLSNAAKFSERGGKVEVSVSRHGENIRIAVKDYGCGIPEEARATIFDRFTQADSSDQRAKGGTGLGLNIAKAIVEGHGGTIGFTSEVGKGTTFYFDLKEVFVES
jgi:signal transduction histidine kinase